jgi:hypothetical protein
VVVEIVEMSQLVVYQVVLVEEVSRVSLVELVIHQPHLYHKEITEAPAQVQSLTVFLVEAAAQVKREIRQQQVAEAMEQHHLLPEALLLMREAAAVAMTTIHRMEP